MITFRDFFLKSNGEILYIQCFHNSLQTKKDADI
jgi:hypothetical protein